MIQDLKFNIHLLLLFSNFVKGYGLEKFSANEDVTTLLPSQSVTKIDKINNSGRNEIEFRTDDRDLIRIDIVEGLQFRIAVRERSQIWENAIVPYEISNYYGNQDIQVILSAMQDFTSRTCVQFRRRSNEISYIRIRPGRGCSAGVGKTPRANRVTLGNVCLIKGVVIHEFMHILGFFHEQNRPDRDEFVLINFDNVIPGAELNFQKIAADKGQTFNLTYDYGSILHYGRFDFARDRRIPTVIPLQEGVRIGQREGLSEKDILKINFLYDCNQRNDTEGNVPTDVGSEDEDVDGNSDRTYRRGSRRRGILGFLSWLLGR